MFGLAIYGGSVSEIIMYLANSLSRAFYACAGFVGFLEPSLIASQSRTQSFPPPVFWLVTLSCVYIGRSAPLDLSIDKGCLSTRLFKR